MKFHGVGAIICAPVARLMEIRRFKREASPLLAFVYCASRKKLSYASSHVWEEEARRVTFALALLRQMQEDLINISYPLARARARQRRLGILIQ